MKAAKAVRDAAEEAENKGKGKKAQRVLWPVDVHNGWLRMVWLMEAYWSMWLQGTAASSSTDGLARTVAKSRETAASGGKGGAASTSWKSRGTVDNSGQVYIDEHKWTSN